MTWPTLLMTLNYLGELKQNQTVKSSNRLSPNWRMEIKMSNEIQCKGKVMCCILGGKNPNFIYTLIGSELAVTDQERDLEAIANRLMNPEEQN